MSFTGSILHYCVKLLSRNLADLFSRKVIIRYNSVGLLTHYACVYIPSYVHLNWGLARLGSPEPLPVLVSECGNIASQNPTAT